MSEYNKSDIEKTIQAATEGLNKVIDETTKSVTQIISEFKQKADNSTNVSGFTLQSAYKNPKWMAPRLYKNVKGERIGGKFKAVLGYGLAGVGLLAVGGGILASTVLAALGGGLLIAAGLPIGVNGTKQVNRAERFREYMKALGNKTVIQLDNLAGLTGKSMKYLQSDLQDMIDRRMFVQGHLDDKGENLITSDETYQQYRHLIAMKEEEDKVKNQEEAILKESMSSNAIAIYREGQEYIAKIQRINTELPGVVITTKLQRLESVVSRILTQLRKNPSKAADLRRLMNYYLPTTWKLLETYKSIEKENVKTDQMKKTQTDIENMLDTISEAFEKLLDQVFRDTAWDVTADINVMNTMLKQEGLKEDRLQAELNKAENIFSEEK